MEKENISIIEQKAGKNNNTKNEKFLPRFLINELNFDELDLNLQLFGIKKILNPANKKMYAI